jgi:hypothetical protein
MKKILCVIGALLLLSLVPAGSALAAPRAVEIAGAITTVSQITSMRNVGPNMIVTETVEVSITGDLSCTGISENRDVCRANLELVGVGTQTYTGEVADKSGSFTAHVVFQGSLVSGTASGVITIISGTGDFSDLHGQLKFDLVMTGANTWSGTYTGKIEFAP